VLEALYAIIGFEAMYKVLSVLLVLTSLSAVVAFIEGTKLTLAFFELLELELGEYFNSSRETQLAAALVGSFATFFFALMSFEVALTVVVSCIKVMF